MIHYDKCPVCASTGIRKVLTVKDYTVSNEMFEILQCAHCSLRFTQDIPSMEDIGRYYRSEDYISHTETNKGLINSLYLKVRKYTLRSKRSLIEDVTKLRSGRILDIGAGTGAFLHHMKESGWEVQGVEPDDQAIGRAKTQYGVTLKPSGDLFFLEPGSFDAITMWHVLEHVHALNEYMEQLKKLIKKDGKIFIAVPNYTSLDAEKYQAHWAAYDVPRHLYHFSPASMQELTHRHGLKILRMQPMWFDSFYVSMLSEKYLGNPFGLIRAFFTGVASNSKALSRPRKASSLIYVLQPDETPM